LQEQPYSPNRDVAVEDIRSHSRSPRSGQNPQPPRRHVVVVTGAAVPLVRTAGRSPFVAIHRRLRKRRKPLFTSNASYTSPFLHCSLPEIGSIQDTSPREVFRRLSVHCLPRRATALSMMRRVFEASRTTFFGTTTSQLPLSPLSRIFVMISTDKAVHPTRSWALPNVCGTPYLSSRNGGTRYVSVRFGNVLGSNGA